MTSTGADGMSLAEDLGTAPLRVLVPFGRLCLGISIRPRDARNITELVAFYRSSAINACAGVKSSTRIHQVLGASPVALVKADFLVEGPGLTVPIPRGTDVPKSFGSPRDRVHFLLSEAGKSRTVDQLQATGASECDNPFLIEVVDGAHRYTALHMLAKDSSVPSFTKETYVLVEVLPITTGPLSVVQTAFAAAYANSAAHMSRSFAFDDSFAMVAVRDAVLQSLLTEKQTDELQPGDAVGSTGVTALALIALTQSGKELRDSVIAALHTAVTARQRLQLSKGEIFDLQTLFCRTGLLESAASARATDDQSAKGAIEYMKAISDLSSELRFVRVQMVTGVANWKGSELVARPAVADTLIQSGLLKRGEEVQDGPGAKKDALQRFEKAVKKKVHDLTSEDPRIGDFLSTYGNVCRGFTKNKLMAQNPIETTTLGVVEQPDASGTAASAAAASGRNSADGGASAGPTGVVSTAESAFAAEEARRRGEGIQAESRAFGTATRILPLPGAMVDCMESPSIADAMALAFPLGLSAEGLAPSLPRSALKLVANSLCFTAGGAVVEGVSALADGGTITTKLSSWHSRARRWRELLPSMTVAGLSKAEKKADEEGSRDISVVARDKDGWAFCVVMGLMTRMAIRNGGTPVLGHEDGFIAIFAAWTTACKVLGYDSLAAIVGPYAIAGRFDLRGPDAALEGRGWSLDVPAASGGQTPLAPRTYAFSLLRDRPAPSPARESSSNARAEAPVADKLDTRTVESWEASLGPVVRPGETEPSPSARASEQRLARRIMQDAIAFIDGDTENPAVITVEGIANLTPVPGRQVSTRRKNQKRTPRAENFTNALAAARSNAAQPASWSSRMLAAVVLELHATPRLGSFQLPEVRHAVLNGECLAQNASEQRQEPQQSQQQAQGQDEKEIEQQQQQHPQRAQRNPPQRRQQNQAVSGKRTNLSDLQAVQEVGAKRARRDGRTLQRRNIGSSQSPAVSLRSLAGRDLGVVSATLTQISKKVLILRGGARSALDVLSTSKAEAVADVEGFRQSLAREGVEALGFDLGRSLGGVNEAGGSGEGDGPVVAADIDAFPPLFGDRYAGVQLLLTDPPFGVRAERSSVRCRTPAQTVPSPNMSAQESFADRRLAAHEVQELAHAASAAAARWSRAAIFLPESLLQEWKDGFRGVAPTRPGSCSRDAECVVVAYEEPPLGSQRRPRGEMASMPLRTTEFVLHSQVLQHRPREARGRHLASLSSDGPSSQSESVSLAGRAVLAGDGHDDRDSSSLVRVQRPGQDELVRRSLARAFQFVDDGDGDSDEGDEDDDVSAGASGGEGRIVHAAEVPSTGEQGAGGVIRWEQKSEHLMAELMTRFLPPSTSPATLVADPFAGTLTTAVAALTMGTNASVVVADSDTEVLRVGRSRLLIRALCLAAVGGGAFAETVREDDGRETLLRVLAVAMARAAPPNATRCLDWGWLPGGDGPLPLFPIIPSHMARHFYQHGRVRPPPSDHPFRNELLFAAAIKKSTLCVDTQAAAVEADASARGLRVGPSERLAALKSSELVAGHRRGVFAVRNFAAGELVCPFYGAYSWVAGTRLVEASVVRSSRQVGGGGAVRKRFDGLHSEGSAQLRYAISTAFPKNLPVWGSKGELFVTAAPFSVGSCVNDPRLDANPDEDRANLAAVSPRMEWLQAVIDAETDEAAKQAALTLSSRHGTNPVSNYFARELGGLSVTPDVTRQMPLLSTRKMMLDENCVVLVAKRDINAGEELFFNYGSSHVFN